MQHNGFVPRQTKDFSLHCRGKVSKLTLYHFLFPVTLSFNGINVMTSKRVDDHQVFDLSRCQHVIIEASRARTSDGLIDLNQFDTIRMHCASAQFPRYLFIGYYDNHTEQMYELYPHDTYQLSLNGPTQSLDCDSRR
jgi:hypothetical protein